ncbi:hypothetical protein BC628DRAFT_25014 [Trametes gibbosa]|nr:hypothetical protein BC628DRAFT_25014 [Trametes gibbosa]
MPPPPPEVVQWLKDTYVRPSVDPDWLEGCYTWILDELNLDPARDMPAILDNVNSQLLGSNLADSMVAGTGFPQGILSARKAFLKGPILVELVGIMDIGQSGYSLLQTYEAREEYRKQADLRAARGEQNGEERKPMPRYARSTLQLLLSDGVSTLFANECKPLPELELGETPLGYKMVLKNVPIRSGIALLQPGRVEFKGHQTADRDALRDAVLFRGLKARIGEDVPLPEHADEPEPEPERAPPQGPAHDQRSPLREISPAAADLEPAASGSHSGGAREHDDDAGQPRRRKRPSRVGRSPSPDPPPRELPLQHSRFFSAKPAAAATGSNDMPPGADEDEDDPEAWLHLDMGDAAAKQTLARAIGLSPPRMPVPLTSSGDDSDGDDEKPLPPAAAQDDPAHRANGIGAIKGKQCEEPVFGDPGSDDYESEFDMDPKFHEALERAEQAALCQANATFNPKSDPDETSTTNNGDASSVQAQQTQTRIKPEPRSQSAARTLFATATTMTLVGDTQRHLPRLGVRAGASSGSSRAGSATGTSSRASEVQMDVIDISDDEVEGDKENVPVPTRHVRRRIARPREPSVVDEIIELSD